MEKNSGLPIEGILETPLNEDVFTLLAKGITRHLDIECLIHLPKSKVKIKVRVKSVVPPKYSQIIITATKSSSDFMDSNQADGFHRASNKIQEKLMTSAWHLYGITNDTAERPICIVIIPGIMTSYAFKKDSEDIKAFNPHLN